MHHEWEQMSNRELKTLVELDNQFVTSGEALQITEIYYRKKIDKEYKVLIKCTQWVISFNSCRAFWKS